MQPLSNARKVCEKIASLSEGTNEFSLESAVYGHHVYKCFWTPCIAEQLMLQQEVYNSSYSRAVTKNDAVIGHLPPEIAKTMWFF